jgi:hypothetical protein
MAPKCTADMHELQPAALQFVSQARFKDTNLIREKYE